MTRKKPCDQKTNPEPHHFILYTPEGRVTDGVCTKCGYEGSELGRKFVNYDEYLFTKRRYIKGKLVRVKELKLTGSSQSPWRKT
jgi:hypothetical protein